MPCSIAPGLSSGCSEDPPAKRQAFLQASCLGDNKSSTFMSSFFFGANSTFDWTYRPHAATFHSASSATLSCQTHLQCCKHIPPRLDGDWLGRRRRPRNQRPRHEASTSLDRTSAGLYNATKSKVSSPCGGMRQSASEKLRDFPCRFVRGSIRINPFEYSSLQFAPVWELAEDWGTTLLSLSENDQGAVQQGIPEALPWRKHRPQKGVTPCNTRLRQLRTDSEGAPFITGGMGKNLEGGG